MKPLRDEPMPRDLLPPQAMAAADRAAIEHGLRGETLMAAAGLAVANAVVERFERQRLLVACGPGNNGGDGFVAARLLADAGWAVRVTCTVSTDKLNGDAAWAARLWAGPVERLSETFAFDEALVVDALFGAGLVRDLDGAAARFIDNLGRQGTAVVAIDVPSGVDGATGAVRGAAPMACLTVTFERAKPGHALLPGRLHTGELLVRTIGIPNAVLEAQSIGCSLNLPSLWLDLLPVRGPLDHKYAFGHALVIGGPVHATGAARLAARAALKVGAGLCSVACDREALPVYASSLLAVMTKPVNSRDELAALVTDDRFNALLTGPGRGVGQSVREETGHLLALGRPIVIDADALTSFAHHREEFFKLTHPQCVLTPHDGEYRRLFDHDGSRLERAGAAARQAGAVIVLKGGDTVIAAPDGRAAIETMAPPSLSTAGSGDVLAGLITGLLAQRMPAFEAACAAVHLHGAAARRIARPLIADELDGPVGGLLAEFETLARERAGRAR